MSRVAVQTLTIEQRITAMRDLLDLALCMMLFIAATGT
jgi:hypothetical protein